jgi:4-aminobutyrate aminotransferase-like enzyme
MNYSQQHLADAVRAIQALDTDAIERLAHVMADVPARGGRLFLLGVGGCAVKLNPPLVISEEPLREGLGVLEEIAQEL